MRWPGPIIAVLAMCVALLTPGLVRAAPRAAPASAAPPPAASAASAAAPIPLGSSLWFACTEQTFKGPGSLRCPRSYDPRYVQTFLRGYARFTPENEFNMQYLEPKQNTFDFSLADQMAGFARAYGKTIRGHTLIWHDENPGWLTNPLIPWSRNTLTSVMRTYIGTVVAHFANAFPGVVGEWDVVNEPLNDRGELYPSLWAKVIGPDYIPTALQLAHAADPSARLLINEQGAEQPGAKSQALLALAIRLKQAGVPLDAVGFEAHVTPYTAPHLGYLIWLMRQYAQAGLQVEITELDVGDDGVVDDPAAKANVFRTYATACHVSINCVGFTVWGVADPYSWLGPWSDALLYDSDFNPKPVVSVVQRLLSTHALPRRPRSRRRRDPWRTRRREPWRTSWRRW